MCVFRVRLGVHRIATSQLATTPNQTSVAIMYRRRGPSGSGLSSSSREGLSRRRKRAGRDISSTSSSPSAQSDSDDAGRFRRCMRSPCSERGRRTTHYDNSKHKRAGRRRGEGVAEVIPTGCRFTQLCDKVALSNMPRYHTYVTVSGSSCIQCQGRGECAQLTLKILANERKMISDFTLLVRVIRSQVPGAKPPYNTCAIVNYGACRFARYSYRPITRRHRIITLPIIPAVGAADHTCQQQ